MGVNGGGVFGPKTAAPPRRYSRKAECSMHGDARLRRIFIFICNVSSPLMYKRGKDCLPQAPSTRGRVDDVTPAQELHVVFFAKGKLSLFDRFLPALLAVLFFQPAPSAALVAPSSQTENPDTVCAKCHQVIYNSYQKTPMAQASGEAMDGLVPGEFTVRFRQACVTTANSPCYVY